MRIFQGLPLVLLCLVIGSAARAQTDCLQVKPGRTQVNVSLETPEPVYNYTLSRKKLKKKGADQLQQWLQANGLTQLWAANELETAGLASGAWGAAYIIKLGSQPFDEYGAYHCVYFHTIEINLFYRTMIYIPQETTKNPCRHEIVNEHELRHHEANRQTVEAYVQQLRQDIDVIVADMEVGYIGRNEVQSRVAVMEQGIKDAVNVYFNEFMASKMKELNAAIDTPEEYASSSARMQACGR